MIRAFSQRPVSGVGTGAASEASAVSGGARRLETRASSSRSSARRVRVRVTVFPIASSLAVRFTISLGASSGKASVFDSGFSLQLSFFPMKGRSSQGTDRAGGHSIHPRRRRPEDEARPN